MPVEARFCPACGSALEPLEPVPAGQERRLVTILFADVTSSTSLGERLDPERLQEVLAAYFGAMREEIEAEGGTVEKFIGDAVMAAFGVPTAHEDDPSRALRAALRMRERLAEVNAELDRRFGVTLQIRTGVNTGEVLAATNPPPGEPMVTGDAVNVAARLEQGADPGGIVVSERTARAARGFRFRQLGERGLRGKAQPVAAVLLEERKRDAPERGVPGLRAPMVGRDRELELLRSLYQRSAEERQPNLVTIYGDPGVGKSRLVAEFVGWAEGLDPGPTIVRGRCLPYGDGVTYWPLAEILKGLANIRDTDPTDVALERIRTIGRDLITTDVAAHPEKATAALAYSVGVEDPAFSFGSMEPREVRLKIHAAWRSLFSSLARKAPVVAVIDDIHWADQVLLDLLEELADRAVGPAFFLCPARPELTERRPGWGGGKRNVSSVGLDPLTTLESDRLVGLLLSVAELPGSVHERILERAEGNPFFLEEIVRHLIDEGVIVREGRRWRAVSTMAQVQIPDTVQAVLAARIDLLDPVEKRALQRAAVVGRVFWPGPVGRLLNGDRDRLRSTLDRLEERDLVLSRLSSSIAGEPEFIFKHILTREVAYESLPRRERAGAHAAVASWIEETAGTRAKEFVELLAYHCLEAYLGARDDGLATQEVEDLRRRAFDALLGVTGEAHRRFAIAKATSAIEQALRIASGPLERITALEWMGTIARSDYRGDLSWGAFKEAVDLRLEHTPDDRQAIARACVNGLENPLRWPGSMKTFPDVDEVKRYLAICAGHVGDERSEEGIRLLTALAFQPFGFGPRSHIEPVEREEAIADGLRAAELARDLGRLDLESAALDGAGSAIVTLGHYGRLRDMLARRLEIAEQIEDPWEAGDAYAMIAWNGAMLGDFQDSVRWGLLGRDRAEHEAAGIVDHCLNWAGTSLFQVGEWDRSLEVFKEAQALLGERSGDPPYFMTSLFGVAAFVHEARGLPGAGGLLEILGGIRGSVLDVSTMAAHWLAWVMARRGQMDRAWALVRETPVRSATFRPFHDQAFAELLALSHRWAEVPAFVESSRSYAIEAGLLALPAHLARLEGRSAIASGQFERGLEALGDAREGFARVGAAWERARTDLDLADALSASGRVEEARAKVDAAAPDLERAGALIELDRMRSLRDRLG
ncbi:MAG TPA: adenylate/guanylate cyclase domain-containing protein [Actinomycetota bacterium]|nr:adenylate/guanylate cyclase domain-containing protein [Actinomycetota bacterium]